MEPVSQNQPQPLSLEDARRLWTLQKQKALLSPADQALAAQAAEWQMWTSHGIRLQTADQFEEMLDQREAEMDRNPAHEISHEAFVSHFATRLLN